MQGAGDFPGPPPSAAGMLKRGRGRPGKRRRRVSIETSTCFRPGWVKLGAVAGANLSQLASSRRPLRERWVLYTIIMAAAGAPDGECGGKAICRGPKSCRRCGGRGTGTDPRGRRWRSSGAAVALGPILVAGRVRCERPPLNPFAGMDTEAEAVTTEAPARPLNCVEDEAAAAAAAAAATAAEDSCDARGSLQPAPAQPPGDPVAQASVSNGEDAGGGAGRELVDLKIIWNKTKHDVKVPLDSTGSELKQKIHSITGILAADNQLPAATPPPSSSYCLRCARLLVFSFHGLPISSLQFSEVGICMSIINQRGKIGPLMIQSYQVVKLKLIRRSLLTNNGL